MGKPRFYLLQPTVTIIVSQCRKNWQSPAKLKVISYCAMYVLTTRVLHLNHSNSANQMDKTNVARDWHYLQHIHQI